MKNHITTSKKPPEVSLDTLYFQKTAQQAIGIGHDVTKYYKNSLTINRAEELGEVLLEELTKLFKD